MKERRTRSALRVYESALGPTDGLSIVRCTRTARPILRHDLRPVFKNDERARRVRGFRSRLGFAVIDGLWGRRRCSEARLPRAALRFAPRDARCTGVRSYAQQ